MDQNKIALVTGASSGIGEALSDKLITQGFNVIGIARSLELLEKIQQNLGECFTPIQCDVANQESVNNLYKYLQDKNIYPDIFFLNAGIAGSQAIEDDGFELNKHHEIMATNYFGILYFIDCWKNYNMPKTHFIVTNSINSIWAPPKGSVYSASKAAIAKAFDSLSLAYIDSDTKFSNIFCGPVKTEGLVGNVPFAWSAEKMAKYLTNFALGKVKSSYPSLFYLFLCKLFNILPNRIVAKIIGYNNIISSR